MVGDLNLTHIDGVKVVNSPMAMNTNLSLTNGKLVYDTQVYRKIVGSL